MGDDCGCSPWGFNAKASASELKRGRDGGGAYALKLINRFTKQKILNGSQNNKPNTHTANPILPHAPVFHQNLKQESFFDSMNKTRNNVNRN